ncbi:MAG: molybdopterin molybdotransferase MoeA [Alphaproteobacteria bacterium]
MISYKEARNILLDQAGKHSLETEVLPIQEAMGRVCAEKLLAPIDIQPFDNSAMDGFAVILSDLKGASETSPVQLQKSNVIAAGDAVPDQPLQAGNCIHIMTGAPLPLAANAVVPIELVTVKDDVIEFTSSPVANANIRRAGEDFKKGMTVLEVGQRVEPQHIMPLATLGIDKIKVYKKLRAAFLATGRELVDDLSAELESGKIYNSNRPYGVAALSAMHVDCVEQCTIADDTQSFDQILHDLMDQKLDIIISSGAVSAGEFDFVRAGLEKIGAEILFHKIKIKPGKPNLFARLPNGTFYFGLPGNPVATAAGLRFFVQPFLQKIMKQSEEKPLYAKAKTPFSKKSGLQIFVKSSMESQRNGELGVSFLDGQASFMVSPFLSMNCWGVVSEEVTEIKVGDIVEIYPLYL